MVSAAQPLERGPVLANDIGAEGLGSRNEPRVVLAHSTRRPALQQSTSASLRQLQPLDGEPLQRSMSRGFIRRSLQELFHCDDRDNDPAAAQSRKKLSGRANLSTRGFPLERD